MSPISLRGVRVHNLKGIDLDLPYDKLIAFCGLSGSGKSSLAIDTLYAEGQRRYIESFSPSTRQFLEKLEKPDADQIDGVPASVAVTAKTFGGNSRSCVGSTTETLDYLRLLFAKIGTIRCHRCQRDVKRDTPESILADVTTWLASNNISHAVKGLIGLVPSREMLAMRRDEFCAAWVQRGFVRLLWNGELFRCDDGSLPETTYAAMQAAFDIQPEREQPTASLERDTEHTAENDGEPIAPIDSFDDVIQVRSEIDDEPDDTADAVFDIPAIFQTRFYDGDVEIVSPAAIISTAPNESHTKLTLPLTSSTPQLLIIADRVVFGDTANETTDTTRILQSLETAMDNGDGAVFVVLYHNTDNNTVLGFSRHLRCEDCGITYPSPEPQLLSFGSPLGACPMCEGFGTLLVYDLELIAPNRAKTLRDGGLAPWTTPAFRATHDELLAEASALRLDVDKPLAELSSGEWQRLLFGGTVSGGTGHGGLAAMFEKLHRQKYKMPMRVFLSRWRSHRGCPRCHGARLRDEALAVRIDEQNIAEWTSLPIRELATMLRERAWTSWERQVGRIAITQVLARLEYLIAVGLGYLTLDRSVRTLSGGEQRRIALTTVLGSSLVNMLYVLDEPTMGLHPCDTERLMESVCALRDRGNTVVVVDHDEAVLRGADYIVELGPEAGERGGQIVFQGTLGEMLATPTSLTGRYLGQYLGRRPNAKPKRRQMRSGMIELVGATGRNLRDVSVAFPLGMLCVVTGVSGAGKTTLVQETLYPAISRALHRDSFLRGLPYRDVQGTSQIDEVVLITQSPIGRSLRSNPVTYLKVFDDIRQVFASTIKARTNNYTAGHFSFNVDGGRCNTCKGEGFIAIEMHFLEDMYVRCPTCHAMRYQREILEVTYRDKNIAEVLGMTVREAFSFFRGQAKVQQKLKSLLDVGLDYLQLGQAANTLSGGESQRLKLAAHLSQPRKGRTLFLMDEPTSGLHFGDVVQLLDCFNALIDTGHSLVVVEHDVQMIRAADWVIDLGPGAAEEGGRVIAQGTPEDIADIAASPTGRVLAGRTL